MHLAIILLFSKVIDINQSGRITQIFTRLSVDLSRDIESISIGNSNISDHPDESLSLVSHRTLHDLILSGSESSNALTQYIEGVPKRSGSFTSVAIRSARSG